MSPLKEKSKNIKIANKTFEWLLCMVGYLGVFLLVSLLFKSIYVDKNHPLFYSTIIVLVVYILNKTLKPVLVYLTIPITGMTLGLFYPCINLFILKLADWLLGSHFNLENIFIAFVVAILLSVMNFIVKELINKITEKVKIHE